MSDVPQSTATIHEPRRAATRRPSPRDRERADFAAYRRSRDPLLRARLIEERLPLARHLARKSGRRAEDLEDLVQVASIGLMRAVDRFDPAHGTAFTSFAVPTIVGEIKRHFRDRGWMVRVPRDLQERVLRVERESDRLAGELGREPTTRELAVEMGLSVEETLEARAAFSARRAESLDAPWDDGDGQQTRADALGAEDQELSRAEAAVDLERLTAVLSERDREVLFLRFRDGLTQREIGSRVGLSQMHISRLLRDGLQRLHEEVTGAPATGGR